MSKIYGYRETDVKNLYEFVKENKKMPLAQAFFAYGNLYGKSKGTVRNLYYAMAKKSREDENFSKEFCGGEKLLVKKNVMFGKDEEKSLVNKINDMVSQGFSVRKAVLTLANGDATLALRFQNKYRNLKFVKKKQTLTGEQLLKNKIFKSDGKDNFKFHDGEAVARLKKEINGLYDRLLKNLKAENEYLKSRLSEYAENSQGKLKLLTDSGEKNRIS